MYTSSFVGSVRCVSETATARRPATALAGCALAAAAVAPAAAAHDGPRDDSRTAGRSGGDGRSGGRDDGRSGGGDDSRRGDGRRDAPRDAGRCRGVVTADGLALRSAPHRGSRVVRYAHRGEVVSLRCKTPGPAVRGNPLRHLLADGTWAGDAARSIDSLGPAPRWC
ncbi:SH3 domain-containing protein [Streptomyces sp. PRKS01-65]|nr:SH3 domain-containing protein [Streptomyces harenosi]